MVLIFYFLSKNIFVVLNWEGYVCLCSESAQEFKDDILEFRVGGIADLALSSDCFKQSLFIGFNMSQEFFFEFGDLWWFHFVQVSTDTTVDDSDLLLFFLVFRNKMYAFE